MARDYTKREHQLVSEWATRTWPHAELHFRRRLGRIQTELQDPTLTDAELRAIGVNRRYVDCLAIEPARLHLVEGKIRGALGALEQLDVYARLLPLTPELEHVRGRPVDRHLVWVIPDPLVEAMARERGILVHVYHPPWVDDYLRHLRGRERSATRSGGLLDQALPTFEFSEDV